MKSLLLVSQVLAVATGDPDQTCSIISPKLSTDNIYYKLVVDQSGKLKSKYQKARDTSIEQWYWKNAVTVRTPNAKGQRYGRLIVRTNICKKEARWADCATCSKIDAPSTRKALPMGSDILNSHKHKLIDRQENNLVDDSISVPRIQHTSAFWRDVQEFYWLNSFQPKQRTREGPDSECKLTSKSKKVLMTFADGKDYTLKAKNLLLSVVEHGGSVDEMWMYNRGIMHPQFVESISDLLHSQSTTRQAWLPGYMIWKVYAIWSALSSLKDGDMLLYLDSDMQLLTDPYKLFCLAYNSEHGIVPFLNMRTPGILHAREAYWTKRDAFILMDVDELAFATTTQSQSGILVLKKTAQSQQFVSDWLSYSMDPRIIDDNPSVLGTEYPHFGGNRHEQTVLSLLVKKRGLKEYPCVYSTQGVVNDYAQGCGAYTHLHQEANTTQVLLEAGSFDEHVIEAKLRKLKPRAVGKKKIRI